MLAERDPAALPWGDLGVDVVIESTGFFTKRDDAAKHLDAGAQEGDHLRAGHRAGRRRSSLGVNFDDAYDADNHHVISNASCTTNCLAPVAKVLHDTVGIEQRPDDDDPRLHGRPAPAGRAAQGPAPRPRRRDQPRARLDRRGQGDRPRASPSSRASCTASRCARPCRPARSSTSPSWSRARRPSRRSTRRSRRRPTPARFDGHPALHGRPDRLLGHRQVTRTRRSSTRS